MLLRFSGSLPLSAPPLLVLALLSCACSTSASRAPDPATANRPPTQAIALPKAALDYPIEYAAMEMIADGIVVGEARVSFEAPCRLGDRTVRPANLAGATNSFVSLFRRRSGEATSWLSIDDGTPLVHVTDDKTDKRHKHVVVDFRHKGYHVDYTRRSATREHHREKLYRLPEGEDVHDLASLAAALRSWRPNKGDEAYSHLVFKRRLWHVGVRFRGEDRIREGRRSFGAWRYDGVARKLNSKTLAPTSTRSRPFTLWLSKNRFRIPVRAVIQTPKHTLELRRTGYQHEPIPNGPNQIPADCGAEPQLTH